MSDEVQLPDYLEELLSELTGPFLRPEEISKGYVGEEIGGAVEALKESVKCQDWDPPHDPQLLDAFVRAGFAWSVRKKRRRAARRASSDAFEPQILWKSDVKGGRPVSKRKEIRRKLAQSFREEVGNKVVNHRSPRGSKVPVRPNSRTITGLESVIPDENEAKTADTLEVTGYDLLGLETTGDLTPQRHNTPTPVTPRSRPTSRPSTPGEALGIRMECPMLVTALMPHRTFSPFSHEVEEPQDEPQRNFTTESSMEFPQVDDAFLRAVSYAHRGKYNRALSASFIRQISPMLRQISPERRQVSEGREPLPVNEFRRLRSPGFMGKIQSEPMHGTGELQASELPSGSISFHPRAEVRRLEQDEDDDEDGGSERYAPLDEDSGIESKSSFSKSSGFEKAFSFEDDPNRVSKELSSEELPSAAPLPEIPAPSLELQAAEPPAPAPPPEVREEANEAKEEPPGEAKDPRQLPPEASIETSISDEEPGVYLVPPWALRAHLQLESRGSTPPSRESMDRELQEVVRKLEQAPALRGRSRPSPSLPPVRPHSSGLVARMRHLVAASPDEPNPCGPSNALPRSALGTSMLSMSHPSRSPAKAQLQAQTKALVKLQSMRKAHHHIHHHALSAATRDLRAEEPPENDTELEGQPDEMPAELSFIEETFFLTEDGNC